jgi:hypothetical protein
MENVCLSGVPETVAATVTGIIALFSMVANIVPKESKLGSVVHFIALNFKVSK